MNKILVLSVSIISLAILVSGSYFIIRGNNGDDLTEQKNKLQDALNLAEKKLNKEEETLDALKKELQKAFPFAVSIQDQMKISIDLVKRTDFMFTNPYGPNPELIIRNFLSGIVINDQRKDINLILSQWQEKIDILSVKEININESVQIKKDIEKIKKFVEDLSKLVNSLTPGNSGLSQFQIDTFKAQLPTVGDIDQVLISIENTINIVDDGSTSSSPIFNTDTNNNQNYPNPPSNPPSNTPSVTPEDVVNQQQVVEEAEEEKDKLQEELEQIEEEIQQSSPTPNEDDDTDSDSENQDANGEENNEENEEENNDSEEILEDPEEETPDIIVQPGEPRLIQGTDPF